MTSALSAAPAAEKKRLLPSFDRCAWVALAALVLVFVGQYFAFGYHICPDTRKYIAFSPRVNFLYPWFLAALRGIFGEESYLSWCAIVQNVFLAWSVFSLCEYLRRQLALSNAGYLGVTFTAGACFLCSSSLPETTFSRPTSSSPRVLPIRSTFFSLNIPLPRGAFPR